MLKRTLLLTALATLVLAAPAAATNYCVPSGGGGCTAEPDLQSALDAAEASSADDTITLGAGTFEPANCTSAPFTYNGAGAGALTLEGAGAGSTILTCPADYDDGGGYRPILTLAGAVTLTGIEIHLPPGQYDRGLELTGAAPARSPSRPTQVPGPVPPAPSSAPPP